MQLNICVDTNDDVRIRNATGWDELEEILVDVLTSMGGTCLAQVAVLSGLSLATLYNLRARRRNPTNDTLTALVKVLAPGHVLSLRGTCAVCPTLPAVEWRPIKGHPAFEGKYVNGKFAGDVRPVAQPQAAE